MIDNVVFVIKFANLPCFFQLLEKFMMVKLEMLMSLSKFSSQLPILLYLINQLPIYFPI